MEQYQCISLLGSGITGKVFLAHDPAGNRVAIKSMFREHIPHISKDEAAIMKSYTPHPNVVLLFAKVDEPDVLHLVMEFVGKDNVMTYVNRTGALPEYQARNIFQGIIAGLEHLHKNGIVHRDLKCENILLTLNQVPKICDLGFATKWKKGRRLHEFCGSFHYAAPEILARKPYEGPEIDIWSVGVVVYAMVARQLPWSGTREEMMSYISSGDYWSLELFSQSFRELLDNILQPLPDLRWSIQQIKKSEWFQADAQFFLLNERGVRASASNASIVSMQSNWSAASGRHSNRSLFSSKRSDGPEKIERSGKFRIKKNGNSGDAETNTQQQTSLEPNEIEDIPEIDQPEEGLPSTLEECEEPPQPEVLRLSQREPTPAQLEQESRDTLPGLDEMLARLDTKDRGLNRFHSPRDEGEPRLELGVFGKTTSVDLGEISTWQNGSNHFLSESTRELKKTRAKNPLQRLWKKAVSSGKFSPRGTDRENSAPTTNSFLERFKNSQLKRYESS